MGILKLLNETSIEQLNHLREGHEAAGLAYLAGMGNRRRGERAASGVGGRRSADHAPTGRLHSDSADSGRRSSDSTASKEPARLNDPINEKGKVP